MSVIAATDIFIIKRVGALEVLVSCPEQVMVPLTCSHFLDSWVYSEVSIFLRQKVSWLKKAKKEKRKTKGNGLEGRTTHKQSVSILL